MPAKMIVAGAFARISVRVDMLATVTRAHQSSTRRTRVLDTRVSTVGLSATWDMNRVGRMSAVQMEHSRAEAALQANALWA